MVPRPHMAEEAFLFDGSGNCVETYRDTCKCIHYIMLSRNRKSNCFKEIIIIVYIKSRETITIKDYISCNKISIFIFNSIG